MRPINRIQRKFTKLFYATCIIIICASLVRLPLLSREIPLLLDHMRVAFATIPTFGKTHFIVGYDQEQGPQEQGSLDNSDKSNQQEVVAPKQGVVRRVLFSPEDKVRKTLLDLIKQEQESIRIAIFAFTDLKIAQALIDAHTRGIRVEVITDPSCLRDQYNKIALLSDKGVAVSIYNAQIQKGRYSNIMHHKFVLFQKNIDNKTLLWTGSFNFTRSAHKANQENVILIDDVDVASKYSVQFERLKQRSYRYEPSYKKG